MNMGTNIHITCSSLISATVLSLVAIITKVGMSITIAEVVMATAATAICMIVAVTAHVTTVVLDWHRSQYSPLLL